MCHVKATLSRSSHDFAGQKGRERTGVPDVVSLSGTDGLAAWDVTRGDAMVSIVLRGAPLRGYCCSLHMELQTTIGGSEAQIVGVFLVRIYRRSA